MSGDGEPGASEPPASPAPRRPGSQGASRGDYLGCGLWALGIFALVIVSFTVGLALRPGGEDDGSTIHESGSGNSAYEIKARLDETRAPCLSLRRDGAEVTAQCGFSPQGEGSEGRYEVTSTELPNGTTVVFAPLPPGTAKVRLSLADGTTEEVATRRTDADDITWFVAETKSAVDGPAELLTSDGSPVPPPS
jgi:hypothetical protein